MTMHPPSGKFEQALQSAPGIYIPMLFKNMTREKLSSIITGLDIFTIKSIEFNEKQLTNGTACYNAFVDVNCWHSNKVAQKMRSQLMRNEEVKVVFNDPWFFICKRKHDAVEIKQTDNSEKSTLSPHEPPFVDLGHIAMPPTNVRGVSRTPSPQTPSFTEETYQQMYDCPECEEGLDGNQLRHTCIQKMIEESCY